MGLIFKFDGSIIEIEWPYSSQFTLDFHTWEATCHVSQYEAGIKFSEEKRYTKIKVMLYTTPYSTRLTLKYS
jgi:hypothetical protein